MPNRMKHFHLAAAYITHTQKKKFHRWWWKRWTDEKLDCYTGTRKNEENSFDKVEKKRFDDSLPVCVCVYASVCVLYNSGFWFAVYRIFIHHHHWEKKTMHHSILQLMLLVCLFFLYYIRIIYMDASGKHFLPTK